MRSKYLLFQENSNRLTTPLKIFFGTKAFQALTERLGSEDAANTFAYRLSNESTVLVSVKSPNTGREEYHIYIDDLVLRCKYKPRTEELDDYGRTRVYDACLQVISINPRGFNDSNSAVKRGVRFTASGGILVTANRINWFCGNEANYRDLAGNDYENALRDISYITIDAAKNAYGQDDDEDDEELVEEDFEPNENLAELIEIADAYSTLENSLAEEEAQKNADNIYLGIVPLEIDNDTDRTSYRLKTKDLDPETFKEGTLIDIIDREENRHGAEIIKVILDEKEESIEAVDVLFNDEISIDTFDATGKFMLSFSPIIMNVQKDAQEKIINNEAAAKYMNHVLGEWQPAGFDDNDLTALKKDLLDRKYPLNDSQMKAVIDGINAKDAYLVMGPPGTGKTTVIVEWVKYFISQGKRVLVSSQNNKAVDNVLVKMIGQPGVDAIRIGSESKVQENVKSLLFTNKIINLRRDINDRTKSSIEGIEKIAVEWKDYFDELNKLERQIISFAHFLDTFRIEIRESFIPVYRGLRSQYVSCVSLQNEITRTAASINKKTAFINECNRRNAFVRFFLKRKIEKDVQEVEELRREYESVVASANSAFSEYNRIAKGYENVCDKIFYGSYRQLKNAISEIGKLAKGADGKRRTEKDLDFDLFSSLYEINFSDMTSVRALINGIERARSEALSELNRAKELSESLDRWANFIRNRQNHALGEMVLEAVSLVGATCIGINTQQKFANLKFDVTIIDEAGQIQIHNALVPMSVSNKLIMLGDHKQIPPIVNQELVASCEEHDISTELMYKSLFEKMYEEFPDSNKTMLDTQFRMPEEIADILSTWFYDGNYKSHLSKRGIEGLIPELSNKPIVFIDTSKSSDKKESMDGSSASNPLEAVIISKLIEAIMKSEYFAQSESDNPFEEIGVISAYKGQVREIKKRLKPVIKDKSIINEMVASLDSFQGQERDIIIYSFTKSSLGSVGFLKELRRLNVAMSRCKKNLIMIGDLRFLRSRRGDFTNGSGQVSNNEFSAFINHVIDSMEDGSGDIISINSFERKFGKCSVNNVKKKPSKPKKNNKKREISVE